MWETGQSEAGLENHSVSLYKIAAEAKRLFKEVFGSKVGEPLVDWLEANQNGIIIVIDHCRIIPWDLLYYKEELPSKDSKNSTESPFTGFLGYNRLVCRPNWPAGTSPPPFRESQNRIWLAEGTNMPVGSGLEEQFKTKDYSVTQLGIDTGPNNEDFFNLELFYEQWAQNADLIHLAGHFGEELPTGLVGIQLADRILDPDHVKERVSGLPLVFLNTCRAEGETESLLTTMIEAADDRSANDNPWCIISPDIRVHVDAAVRFQQEFYTLLLEQGLNAHEAFLRARMTILHDETDPNPIGLAYGYHGASDFYLTPKKQKSNQ